MGYKVSIVIPIYNVAQYLQDCLLSVQAQTLDGIEVIAVNDGSTDDSLAILEAFCSGKENYIIIDQKNQGLSGARNAGMARATGEYLYFLDSDDTIEPTLCEACYRAAQQDDLDIVLFNGVNRQNESMPFVPWMATKDRTMFVDSRVKSGQEQYIFLCKKEIYRAEVWLYFIKRSFLEKTALTFAERVIYEDVLFTPMLFILANRTKHLTLSLHSRTVRQGSIMTQVVMYQHSRGFLQGAEGLLLFMQTHKQRLKEETLLHLQARIELSITRAARWCGKQPASAERTAFEQEIRAVVRGIWWRMRVQSRCLFWHPVAYMKVFSIKEKLYYLVRQHKKKREIETFSVG